MFPLLSIKQIFWLHILMLSILISYRKRDVIRSQIRSLRDKYSRRYTRPIDLNGSFTDDVEAGLSSNTFDIESQNAGDSRDGLDDHVKEEIKKMMNEQNMSFDAARLAYTQSQFNKNDISADGVPRDPKTVTLRN